MERFQNAPGHLVTSPIYSYPINVLALTSLAGTQGLLIGSGSAKVTSPCVPCGRWRGWHRWGRASRFYGPTRGKRDQPSFQSQYVRTLKIIFGIGFEGVST